MVLLIDSTEGYDIQILFSISAAQNLKDAPDTTTTTTYGMGIWRHRR